ncbi:FecR family protein [Echinicola vietnamensis]|uniref:Fe2+-dicitrate sensor, membrane component n=1 Tax=Echinicola vietnamensis (strain DSM 17526 / LMG 23754 / KMM 6221) TaxID=926556 RepID=L0G2H4_ECHVK|nr:FecR family protein [Echinicola vietnamensis]AGA79742.1 Fe2+-dicitrate sensor, membrane component [Echinicola vietnamensis DSM 17526]
MEDGKLIRYFEGTASAEEVNEISRWLDADEANEEYFQAIKAHFIAAKFHETSQEVDLDKEWHSFRKGLDTSSPAYFLPTVMRYAAAILLVFGVGYVLYTFQFSKENSPAIIPENTITLKLDNGELVAIDGLSDLPIKDAAGRIIGNKRGGKLIYLGNDAEQSSGEPGYNTLTVPYAKRFEIILPDSTHVTLNAGSSLTYPTSFENMATRKVALIGEGYFNVKKDKAHPFIVNAGKMNVRVLGTQFNLSTYPEDNLIQTALVEGKVSIYGDDEPYRPEASPVLHAGHLAIWDKTSKDLQINETSLDMYTAWLSGKIIFKNVPFENIIKKLERHYNVEIINLDGALAHEHYTASFDVESIEEVMETFKRAYGLQYQIEGNSITIHQ